MSDQLEKGSTLSQRFHQREGDAVGASDIGSQKVNL